MARPNWEYIRVDVLLPGHPKLAGLPRSARWTLVELWCFAGRYHTDGFINDDVWGETGPPADRRKLVERGLAHRVDGGFQMHDFVGPNGHQRSKAEIEELSQRRAEAGRKGGTARGKSEASASANGEASANQDASHVPKQTEAEAEAEADKDPPRASRVPPRGRTATRLPADFAVTADMVAWARANAPHVDGKRETEKFTDHWNSASGARARKLDWTAAWRNWMRKAEDDIGERQKGRPSHQPTDDDFEALRLNWARPLDGMEEAGDQRGNGRPREADRHRLPAAEDWPRDDDPLVRDHRRP